MHTVFFNAEIMPNRDKQCINNVSTWGAKRVKQFVQDIHTVYGEKGLLAMGFWIATAFSHSIFEKYNFFPFLSLYGEPHTGKSTLTLLLNRCFFVNSEGLSMSKGSTLKGEQRQLAKKSGLVMPLLEFNNVESSTFDLNMLLGAYNRNAISSRAAYSNDNKTIEIDLRCSLAFVQNFEPFKTSAQKERVISLYFAEDSLDTSSEAFKRLTAYKPEELTGFGDFIFKHRAIFEPLLVMEIDALSNDLMAGGVIVDRISKNHSIPFAGCWLLLKILDKRTGGSMLEDLKKDLLAYVVSVASKKCENAVSDLDVAEDFFGIVDAVENGHGVYREETELRINMTDTFTYLDKHHPNLIDRKQLYKELERHSRFIDKNKVIYLKAVSKKQKCWVFKL